VVIWLGRSTGSIFETLVARTSPRASPPNAGRVDGDAVVVCGSGSKIARNLYRIGAQTGEIGLRK
jgi:hypothetical protein